MPYSAVLQTPLAYIDGALHFSGHSLRALADTYGTPLYVYSAPAMLESLATFRAGAGERKYRICYAIKANSSLAVIQTLARAGCGGDIVSNGELYRAHQAGIPSDHIVFSGVGKTDLEINQALQAQIMLFSVESVAELERINALAIARNQRAPISLRVNPDVDANTHPYISTGLKDNKFGLPHTEVVDLYEHAVGLAGIKIAGIGFHIGSQLMGLDGFRDAARKVCAIVKTLRARGIVLEYIDCGGGLGIRYENDEPPAPGDYVRLMCEELPFPEATLLFEPGRNLVGNAGVLLGRVLYTKSNQDRHFIICDVAMNDLLRPALYRSYHSIWPLVEAQLQATRTADLVGPICESADFLVRARDLPCMASGDLLAIASTGAYGFVMSSNYNSRPRPAEVLLDGNGMAHLVRERENLQDLTRGESLLN